MAGFILSCRQLGAILKKNALLRAYSPLSTIIEICMPIAFMFLLVYFKTLATQYDSPPVAYACGQTYPWQYASTTSELLTDAQCLNIPDTCNPPQGRNKYYQLKTNLSEYGYDGNIYSQNGYIASSVGASYPLYGVQVSDDATFYDQYVPDYPIALANPSTNFVGIMKKIRGVDVYSDAGRNVAKVAIVSKVSDDATLNAQTTKFYNYLMNMLISQGESQTANKNMMTFTSESELIDYISTESYDDPDNFHEKIAFAIIINEVDINANIFDYSIRSNYTYPWEQRFTTVACLGQYTCDNPQSASASGTSEVFSMPSTTTFTDQVSRPQLSTNYYGYAYTGFLALQKVTDEYFLSLAKAKGDIDNALENSGTPTVTTKVSLTMMPTTPYTANDFQSVIGSLLPIFYMLAFLYPFSRFIRNLVLEKEEKIKEGMKIMGLSDTVYGLSWLITLGIQVLISAIGILLVTRHTVFEYSDDLPIFCYFFFFGISVVMFSFLLATFFSKSKTAAIMGSLFFFATYFPYYAVTDPSMSTFAKLLVSLFSPSAFALGAGSLADLEAGQIGANTT